MIWMRAARPMVVGATVAVLAAALAAPRWQKTDRVDASARAAIDDERPMDAARIYFDGAKGYRSDHERDRMAVRACQLAAPHADGETARAICAEAARGGRSARAGAALGAAAVAEREGRFQEAAAAIREISTEHWDSYQAVVAGRQMLALIGRHPEVLETAPETAVKALRDVDGAAVADRDARDGIAATVVYLLDHRRAPPAEFFTGLDIDAHDYDVRTFLERLAAIAVTHPHGNLLPRAAETAGLTIRPDPQEVIRYLSHQFSTPPERRDVIAWLRSSQTVRDLADRFNEAGDAANHLRVEVADELLTEKRYDDVLAVLHGVASAPALDRSARAYAALERDDDALQAWQRICTEWPDQGGPSAQAAEFAAEILIRKKAIRGSAAHSGRRREARHGRIPGDVAAPRERAGIGYGRSSGGTDSGEVGRRSYRARRCVSARMRVLTVRNARRKSRWAAAMSACVSSRTDVRTKARSAFAAAFENASESDVQTASTVLWSIEARARTQIPAPDASRKTNGAPDETASAMTRATSASTPEGAAGREVPGGGASVSFDGQSHSTNAPASAAAATAPRNIFVVFEAIYLNDHIPNERPCNGCAAARSGVANAARTASSPSASHDSVSRLSQEAAT
ncbi:MAG: hypothetical protein M5R36_13575 [Deltaproteobacteria bacterium]|nr:hypothetical protein [Deltaproteobacteria bacterium]